MCFRDASIAFIMIHDSRIGYREVLLPLLYLEMRYLNMTTVRHNEHDGSIYKNVPEINQYKSYQISAPHS